jgi:hypothetical protein
MHSDFFHRIRSDGGKVEFFVGWFLKTQAGDDFDLALLSRLVRLQIDLALDNYYDPELPSEEV